MDPIGTDGKAPEDESKLACFHPRGLSIEPLSDLHILRLFDLNLSDPCDPWVPQSGTSVQKEKYHQVLVFFQR